MKYFVFVTILALFSCGSNTEILAVRSNAAPCTKTSSHNCLQIKRGAGKSWENFNAVIEGFSVEPGYDYQIKVEPVQDKDALAHHSQKRYVLKKIVLKEKRLVNSSLNGTFSIEMLNGKDLRGERISLTFDAAEQRVYGKNICNRFSGSYTNKDGELAISPVMTTRKMCNKSQLELEFLELLGQANAFAISDDKLYLRKENKILLTAKRSTIDE